MDWLAVSIVTGLSMSLVILLAVEILNQLQIQHERKARAIYKAGRKAAKLRLGQWSNPYIEETERQLWLKGYFDQVEFQEQKDQTNAKDE